LVVITARKASRQARDEGRQKRGGNAVRGESVFATPSGSGSAAPGLDQVVGVEPTPEFAAQVAEECGRLLEALPTPELRSVARWKMEGHTNGEIAARLGCVARSVERMLQVIRVHWDQPGGAS
jgi:DNA-directed RNA polymerase specialized sigma24 family protein